MFGTTIFHVWYDDLFVFPGDNWGTAVGEALEQSEAMIVLLTRDGLRSKKVTSEAQFALSNLRYDHRLIPVVSGLEEAEVKKSIPWVFRHLMPVYFTDNGIEQGIMQIVRTLNESRLPWHDTQRGVPFPFQPGSCLCRTVGGDVTPFFLESSTNGPGVSTAQLCRSS